jgi:periplasmic protein TonB
MSTRLLVVAVLAASLLTSCGSASSTASVPEGIRVPVVVTRVEPEYPPELRHAGVQGVVEISGTVPKEGGVLRNPRVVRSDDARLEPFALAAVSRWIWTPGMQDGQAVDVEFTTTVRFSIRR